MSAKAVLAAILIAVGVIALAYQGITYTKREKVLDVGAVEMTREKEKTVPLPPVIGVVSLASGVVLLVAGRKKG